MFERFSDRARYAAEGLAREEAYRLGCGFVGSGALVLGLIREGEGVAAQTIADMGVSRDELRARIEQTVGYDIGVPPEQIIFHPLAQRALDLSLVEADRMNYKYVDTGHVLLGVMQGGDAIARILLDALSGGLSDTRLRVAELSGLRGNLTNVEPSYLDVMIDEIIAQQAQAQLYDSALQESMEIAERLLPAARAEVERLEARQVELLLDMEKKSSKE